MALLVLAVVLAILGIIAGRWQWSVAHDVARADAVREIQQRPVEPLGAVVAPHAGFPDEGSGQLVSTRGEYTGDQRLVVGRLMDGAEVTWVLERFVVAQTDANLAVVRGSMPMGESPPPPPRGAIDLVGSLAPPEAPDAGVGLRPEEMTTVDIAQLVNEWPGEMYNAFAFAVSEDGSPSADAIQRVPPPLPDTSLNWRNVMYAAQWWAFSAFALWMWTKTVRQAARRDETVEAVEIKEDVT